jgi:hypothetical protein
VRVDARAACYARARRPQGFEACSREWAENHCYAIALHFVYYNFCKVHKTLRVTPAMEAKLAKKPMTIEEIVRLTDK